MTTILTKAPFFDRGSLLKKLKSLGKSPTEWKGSKELLAEVEKHEPGFTNSAEPTPAEAIAAARSVSADLDQKADQLAELGRKNAELNVKLDGLLAKIAGLKASQAPAAAVARQLETVTRKTAADLSAARREPAAVKPAFMTADAYLASIAKPQMTRAEFSKVPHGKRSELLKQISLVP